MFPSWHPFFLYRGYHCLKVPSLLEKEYATNSPLRTGKRTKIQQDSLDTSPTSSDSRPSDDGLAIDHIPLELGKKLLVVQSFFTNKEDNDVLGQDY